MHLLVRETHTLDDAEAAVDLGQSPAELVFLSFSDSDLGAAAAAWAAMGAHGYGLRLANLARLRHPMSVDLYTETVIAQARCVVVRLLGGLDYWRYGAEEVAALCADRGIPLAIIPGDARDDARLAALSTVAPGAWSRLDACLREGGPSNTARALRLAAHLAGLGPDDEHEAQPMPAHGIHPLPGVAEGPVAAIVFYRSHLLAGDIAPIEALAAALRARGLDARALFVASLKAPESAAFVAATLADWRPAVVLNATHFCALLDSAGAPVLQLLQPGASRDAWAASTRGLGPADLAMQVVLPELDGRLLTTAISFKAEQDFAPGLEFARLVHRPDPGGVALAADRAAGWARLATTPRAQRRVAIVLSDYPGPDEAAAGQIGHAVGLDTFASLRAMLRLLHDHGYDCADADLAHALCHAPPTPVLDLPAYRALFATLPEPLQRAVTARWGKAQATDLSLRHARTGKMLVAVQPDRGRNADRRAAYHDPDQPPGHAYIAFYLWLRQVARVHALLHLGTHGTLEWLPGKAAALSDACWPAALARFLPVIYPFIVNNPGEAAAAKRRLGAVTIGHLTPPLRRAGVHGDTAALEALLDDYAAADGMDPRRTALLRREILDRAASAGLLAEAGAAPDSAPDTALARLDAYLCDVKDLSIRDGLHVFGCAPAPTDRALLLDSANPAALDASPAAERAALLAALDGRFVAPGPAGAPSRGRADVLPTGRNLFAIDPRGVPTRGAVTLAERAAADLLTRHRQDHGDWPRSIVLDLWASTTLRTGGEDLALALVLLGAQPVWDAGSNRVAGIEILPLALLDRPRIDVTLRISGLFRDAFEAQMGLFDQAVRAIAARDEAPDWNPLAGVAGPTRIYGAAPGCYGAGGDAAGYLAATSAAYGLGRAGEADAAGFAARIAAADAFVHQQDHAETDILDGRDYAAHEGGFAAAAASLGVAPALYHLDTSAPDKPRTRTVTEEIARVVRGRAANPAWIAGMIRHGYRGAAEMARTLDALADFAERLPQRLDGQFDLLFDATLGAPEVDDFLRHENPDARAAMAARFAQMLRHDLWRPRRNAVGELLC